MLIIEIEKRHNKMVDRIRWDTVSYLPFYYVFFQFLLLTIFNLQANILTTKDILSNLGCYGGWIWGDKCGGVLCYGGARDGGGWMEEGERSQKMFSSVYQKPLLGSLSHLVQSVALVRRLPKHAVSDSNSQQQTAFLNG